MADYTYMSLTIIDCPEGEAVNLVIGVIESHFNIDLTELTLGEAIAVAVAPLGTVVDEIASELVGIGSVAFEGYEDPKYEYPGQVVEHVPGLGSWTPAAFEGGEVAFSLANVKEILAADESRRRYLMGTDITEALAALRLEHGGTVLQPMRRAEVMYARLTKSGSACAETALCDLHIDQAAEFRGREVAGGSHADDPVTDHVDCSLNEVLACQVCGCRTDYIPGGLT